MRIGTIKKKMLIIYYYNLYRTQLFVDINTK